MIIMFLVLNCILFLWTSLSIVMFNNNLKNVSRSIDIYLNPKAYKPESEVRLISLLIDKYSNYDDKEAVDLDSLIKDSFYSVKIGKFKVSTIESVATQGKRLLWFSIITMTLLETLTVGLGESNINSIMIILSIGMGIVLAFFELYSDLIMERENLFLKIKNHIHNEYPQFRSIRKEKEEISCLLKKISQLENKITSQEKRKNEKSPAEELQEEDIVQILKCFDLFT